MSIASDRPATGHLVSPATLDDLAAVFGAGDYRVWVLARRQLDRGRSFALRRGGATIAIGGLAPIGAGEAEAWFWPGPHAARSMVAIVRAARLTVSASGYRAIRAHVRSDAGRKIALLAGFRPAAPGDGIELWIARPAEWRG